MDKSYEKYLKYKNKYLELKKLMQFGGMEGEGERVNEGDNVGDAVELTKAGVEEEVVGDAVELTKAGVEEEQRNERGDKVVVGDAVELTKAKGVEEEVVGDAVELTKADVETDAEADVETDAEADSQYNKEQFYEEEKKKVREIFKEYDDNLIYVECFINSIPILLNVYKSFKNIDTKINALYRENMIRVNGMTQEGPIIELNNMLIAITNILCHYISDKQFINDVKSYDKLKRQAINIKYLNEDNTKCSKYFQSNTASGNIINDSKIIYNMYSEPIYAALFKMIIKIKVISSDMEKYYKIFYSLEKLYQDLILYDLIILIDKYKLDEKITNGLYTHIYKFLDKNIMEIKKINIDNIKKEKDIIIKSILKLDFMNDRSFKANHIKLNPLNSEYKHLIRRLKLMNFLYKLLYITKYCVGFYIIIKTIIFNETLFKQLHEDIKKFICTNIYNLLSNTESYDKFLVTKEKGIMKLKYYKKITIDDYIEVIKSSFKSADEYKKLLQKYFNTISLTYINDACNKTIEELEEHPHNNDIEQYKIEVDNIVNKGKDKILKAANLYKIMNGKIIMTIITKKILQNKKTREMYLIPKDQVNDPEIDKIIKEASSEILGLKNQYTALIQQLDTNIISNPKVDKIIRESYDNYYKLIDTNISRIDNDIDILENKLQELQELQKISSETEEKKLQELQELKKIFSNINLETNLEINIKELNDYQKLIQRRYIVNFESKVSKDNDSNRAKAEAANNTTDQIDIDAKEQENIITKIQEIQNNINTTVAKYKKKILEYNNNKTTTFHVHNSSKSPPKTLDSKSNNILRNIRILISNNIQESINMKNRINLDNIQYNINVIEIIKNFIENMSEYKINYIVVMNPQTVVTHGINFKYTIPSQKEIVIGIRIDIKMNDTKPEAYIEGTNISVPNNFNINNETATLYDLSEPVTIDYKIIDIKAIKFITECLSRNTPPFIISQ